MTDWRLREKLISLTAEDADTLAIAWSTLLGRGIRVAQLNLLDLVHCLHVERELRRGNVLFELRHRGCADDRGAHEPATRYIAQGQLHQRQPAPLGERRVRVHRLGDHRLAEPDTERIEQ